MTTNIGWMTWSLFAAGAALVVAGSTMQFGSTSEPAAEPIGAAGALETAALPTPNPDLPVVHVWKSPTCGCCAAWVAHMREAGFQVEVEDVVDVTPHKVEHGVAPELQSCHTALVEGYALEGHVPAQDVLRLLDERPQVTGLAVPGMPTGSPGMEMGGRVDRYDVVAFTRGGGTSVWSSHP
jgi:hypothetical protein